VIEQVQVDVVAGIGYNIEESFKAAVHSEHTLCRRWHGRSPTLRMLLIAQLLSMWWALVRRSQGGPAARRQQARSQSR